MKGKSNKLKIIIGTLILLLLICIVGVVRYLNFSLPADEQAVMAMTSTSLVKVEDTENTISFMPTDKVPTTGLIYYPGGQVEPESFAYAAREIASKGYLVVIQKMPFNLAMFGKDKAYDIVEQYQDIDNWYLSGFSLGGISACMALSQDATPFDGLILYASYTTKDYDLSNSNLKVLSINGSNDGLATPEDIEKGKPYLPKDTIFYTIEGGNHTQNAIYGEGNLQKGDNPASIDRMEQQDIIIEKTVEFMSQGTLTK